MIALKRLLKFITSDVWNIRLADLSAVPSFFLRQLRIMLLAFQGLIDDNCSQKASALTYLSLLSIVPVLAIAFGIAKGFGFQALLHEQLLENFSTYEEVMTPVINTALLFLDNTRGGLVAITGVGLLLWIVIQLLTNIEKAFNDIWHIRRVRSLGRKFSDYLSILLISPLFIALSVSITVYISTELSSVSTDEAVIEVISPFFTMLLKTVPYLLIWILFVFINIFIPNTRVNFTSGLIAGIIAGSIYQVSQWGYIKFQFGVAKYNAIYGSFAALPLFLIWLQISWLIVLFGVEIAYAHQNVQAYEFAKDASRISPAYRKLLSLRITHLLVDLFAKGQQPLTTLQISNVLKLPIKLVRDIIARLVDSNLVSETNSDTNKDSTWQPASDINLYTIKYVIDALENAGVKDIDIISDKKLTRLTASMKAFNDSLENSPHNLLLKDL